MPTVAETSAVGNDLASAIELGERTISQNQEITFTKYVRLVLPLDGYVFWVKADLLTDSARYNAARYNQVPYNAGGTITPAATLVVQGSLHWMSNTDQKEDETAATNRIVFTSTEEVQDFNEIGSNALFIADFEGMKFAFNAFSSRYLQAGILHYTGTAVYPALQSQLIDGAQGFDQQEVIVSNSLPLWLALDKFMPMYPSFLVDSNIRPPYASVHIEPRDTEAIQAAPRIMNDGSHYQLVKDRVRITIYGLRNFNALDFQDYVFQYSLDTDAFGVMDMPIIRDEKRTQSELSVIAMKKSFTIDINYYQTRVNNIARQLIKSAVVNFTLE